MDATERLLSPQVQARRLYNKLQWDVDKLHFIRRKRGTSPDAFWILGQVSMDDTDPEMAKELGFYKVFKYVRHPDDAAVRPVKDCRFWPEVREKLSDGRLGKLVLVKPQKFQRFLQERGEAYSAVLVEVNLLEDGIVGPFNFMQKKDNNEKELHRIAPQRWRQLKRMAPGWGVDVQDVDQRIPLQEGARAAD